MAQIIPGHRWCWSPACKLAGALMNWMTVWPVVNYHTVPPQQSMEHCTFIELYLDKRGGQRCWLMVGSLSSSCLQMDQILHFNSARCSFWPCECVGAWCEAASVLMWFFSAVTASPVTRPSLPVLTSSQPSCSCQELLRRPWPRLYSSKGRKVITKEAAAARTQLVAGNLNQPLGTSREVIASASPSPLAPKWGSRSHVCARSTCLLSIISGEDFSLLLPWREVGMM